MVNIKMQQIAIKILLEYNIEDCDKKILCLQYTSNNIAKIVTI